MGLTPSAHVGSNTFVRGFTGRGAVYKLTTSSKNCRIGSRYTLTLFVLVTTRYGYSSGVYTKKSATRRSGLQQRRLAGLGLGLHCDHVHERLLVCPRRV